MIGLLRAGIDIVLFKSGLDGALRAFHRSVGNVEGTHARH
jgi:hypothetical protein